VPIVPAVSTAGIAIFGVVPVAVRAAAGAVIPVVLGFASPAVIACAVPVERARRDLLRQGVCDRLLCLRWCLGPL
jgi:hypothetical protein